MLVEPARGLLTGTARIGKARSGVDDGSEDDDIVARYAQRSAPDAGLATRMDHPPIIRCDLWAEGRSAGARLSTSSHRGPPAFAQPAGRAQAKPLPETEQTTCDPVPSIEPRGGSTRPRDVDTLRRLLAPAPPDPGTVEGGTRDRSNGSRRPACFGQYWGDVDAPTVQPGR